MSILINVFKYGPQSAPKNDFKLNVWKNSENQIKYKITPIKSKEIPYDVTSCWGFKVTECYISKYRMVTMYQSTRTLSLSMTKVNFSVRSGPYYRV